MEQDILGETETRYMNVHSFMVYTDPVDEAPLS